MKGASACLAGGTAPAMARLLAFADNSTPSLAPTGRPVSEAISETTRIERRISRLRSGAAWKANSPHDQNALFNDCSIAAPTAGALCRTTGGHGV